MSIKGEGLQYNTLPPANHPFDQSNYLADINNPPIRPF